MTRKVQRPLPEASASESEAETFGEDTALRSLSRSERATLDIDAWEPSLLRALLEAHDKLRRDRG